MRRRKRTHEDCRSEVFCAQVMFGYLRKTPIFTTINKPIRVLGNEKEMAIKTENV